MVNFDRVYLELKLLGFRAISITFLSFLSQKTYPGKFLRPEVILSRSFPKKVVFGRVLPLSSICHIFKNAVKSEPGFSNLYDTYHW